MTVVSHNVSTRLQVTERTDTDGDSLWDAWENKTYQFDKSFLLSGRSGVSAEFSTDWQNPDTDGDRDSDGWIGVYNVSYDHDRGIPYADNVVLYREHLQSGGISGDEMVNEQVDVHHTDEVASAVGADIDNDGTKEHSNVHIGELQWGSDPQLIGQTPSIGVSVEADFINGHPANTFDTSGWENSIEDNYALYGISLDLIRDDTVDSVTNGNVGDIGTDLYLLVTTEMAIGETWGINLEASTQSVPVVPGRGHLLYAEAIADDQGIVSNQAVQRSAFTSRSKLLGAFVEMHELGHSFRIGRADDRSVPLPPGEVYSGIETSGTFSKPNDMTPELVRIGGDSAREWSVMRIGWDGDSLVSSDGATHFVFSIEELTTIENPST